MPSLLTHFTDDLGWTLALSGPRHLGEDRLDEDQAPRTLEVPWGGILDPGRRIGPTPPTALEVLSWRSRSTPLIGRDADREALLDWARDGVAVKIRFLRGPAGVGKTRLAAEVAEALAREGWSAGFGEWRIDATWRMAAAGALLILDEPPSPGDRLWLELAHAEDDTFFSGPPRRVLVLDRGPDRDEPIGRDASVQELGPLTEDAARTLYAWTREAWSWPSDEDAWSPGADVWRRPLQVMAAAVTPAGTVEHGGERTLFETLAQAHVDWRRPDARSAIWGRLEPGGADSLSGAALVCLLIRRDPALTLDRGAIGLPPLAVRELARLDRLVSDGGLSEEDRQRLAADFRRSRPWRQLDPFSAAIEGYGPRPGSFLGRLALCDATVKVNTAAMELADELMVLAAQRARELGPEAAIEPAERALALYPCEPEPSCGRRILDSVWMLAHYLEEAASPRAVEFRREATRFQSPILDVDDEGVLAMRLLAECRFAAAEERLDVQRRVVRYHRRAGRTLLLALSLERLASLAPGTEADAARGEARAIRRELPAIEARWFPEGMRGGTGTEPIGQTHALVLAIHLEQVRRFASDPEVRRYLAAALESHTQGYRGGSAEYLALLDRHLRKVPD